MSFYRHRSFSWTQVLLLDTGPSLGHMSFLWTHVLVVDTGLSLGHRPFSWTQVLLVDTCPCRWLDIQVVVLLSQVVVNAVQNKNDPAHTCDIQVHNTAHNGLDNLLCYHPNNHYSSGVVYRGWGGGREWRRIKVIRGVCHVHCGEIGFNQFWMCPPIMLLFINSYNSCWLNTTQVAIICKIYSNYNISKFQLVLVQLWPFLY